MVLNLFLVSSASLLKNVSPELFHNKQHGPPTSKTGYRLLIHTSYRYP